MGTKSSKRRQMTTLICSLGAIVIGGVAADALANPVVFVEGSTHCYANLPDENGNTRQILVAHCTGSTHVCECSATLDGNGNVVSVKGECCPNN